MNASTLPSPSPAVDEDVVEQARTDDGVAPQGQHSPGTEQPGGESRSALAGGGAMVGAMAGAGVGAVVGGPLGAVVGGTLGSVAGAVSAVAGTATHEPDPTETVHLHVEDSGGTGRPVVLIHGWPLSSQAWSLQTDALRNAGYRVIAYDRRGFGQSGKPESGYDYDTLTDDLERVLVERDLQNVTLVGFSMGGGEVARYVGRHSEARLRSVVFAAAVPPAMMKTADNPDGPLTPEKAQEMKEGLEKDRDAFFDQFTRDFFSAHGALKVSEPQRSEAVSLCHQSTQQAAVACMDSFGLTDFRDDLRQVTVPTLVIHGDADAIVPIEGSGLRTHRIVGHSELVTIPGGPHGLNVSHADAFNEALLAFLSR